MAELDPTKNAVPLAPVPENQPAAREHATQLLADVQNLTHALLAQNAKLVTPAAITSVVLTSTRPKVRDDVGEGLECLSFGIYNPSDLLVYVAGDGSDPSDLARGGALPVPGKSLLIWPAYCRDLDVATDPANLAVGDARVWILRYETVQPAVLARAGA